jgi:histidine triad (HIT) family protein
MDAQKPCPFCVVLVNDELKQVIKSSKNFTAIRKLKQTRNVNFLIISNTHVKNLKMGSENSGTIDMNELIAFINQLSMMGPETNKQKEKGWSIHINNGEEAGQEVFHFHAHITSQADRKTWGL